MISRKLSNGFVMTSSSQKYSMLLNVHIGNTVSGTLLTKHSCARLQLVECTCVQVSILHG